MCQNCSCGFGEVFFPTDNYQFKHQRSISLASAIFVLFWDFSWEELEVVYAHRRDLRYKYEYRSCPYLF